VFAESADWSSASFKSLCDSARSQAAAPNRGDVRGDEDENKSNVIEADDADDADEDE
jgi:hypothetical protein